MAEWTPEMDEYIRINTKYYGNGRLCDIINAKFDTDLTIEDIEEYKRKNKLFHGHTIKYTPEIREFIYKHISGHTAKELAAMLEDEFGVHFSEHSIAYFKGKNGLAQKGIGVSLFTPEQQTYIRANFILKSNQQLADELNEQFGTDVTATQVGAWKSRHGLKSGLAGKFIAAMQGEERMQGEYMMTKTGKGQGPRNWKYSHRLLWESVNGPIPRNKRLIFKDGDHTNVTIDNLALIDANEHMELANRKMFTQDKRLTEAGIAIAKLNIAERVRRRELKLIEKYTRKVEKRVRKSKLKSRKFAKFTPEIEEFLRETHITVPDAELPDMIDERFGVRIPKSTIQTWKVANGLRQKTVWTDDMKARLAELWQDHIAPDCTEILNKEFGTNLGRIAVERYASRCELKKLNPKNVMTPRIEQFLRENADKYSNPELTQMINEKFGTEFNDISAYKTKFGLVDHIDPDYAEKSYKVYKRIDLLRGSDAPELAELAEEAERYIDEIKNLLIKKEMEMRYIYNMTWDAIADANASGGAMAQSACASRKRVSRYIERLGRAIKK